MSGKKKTDVWGILGWLLLGYLGIRYLLPLLFARSATRGNYASTLYGSGAAGGAGSLPFAYSYRTPNSTFSTSGNANSLLSQLLQALTGKSAQASKSSGGGSGSGSGGAQPRTVGTNVGSAKASNDTTIAEALLDPLYSGGASQNLLAGIFNIQQGYGDFAGDSQNTVLDSFGIDPYSVGIAGYDSPTLDNFQFDQVSPTPTLLADLPLQDYGTGWADGGGGGGLADYSAAAFDSAGLDNTFIDAGD